MVAQDPENCFIEEVDSLLRLRDERLGVDQVYQPEEGAKAGQEQLLPLEFPECQCGNQDPSQEKRSVEGCGKPASFRLNSIHQSPIFCGEILVLEVGWTHGAPENDDKGWYQNDHEDGKQFDEKLIFSTEFLFTWEKVTSRFSRNCYRQKYGNNRSDRRRPHQFPLQKY